MFFPTHVALRMLIMQVLARQLPFLANRYAELAVLQLFWQVNCIKNRPRVRCRVALLLKVLLHAVCLDLP